MLKRAAKFAKRASSEIRYVEFNKVTPFDQVMSGGIVEYSQRGMPYCMEQKSPKMELKRNKKMIYNYQANQN